jgi:dethiobiotin synthetase
MDMGYFVTGTDTGVGKTLVACGLLRALGARGLRAVGMKPVAAGCEPAPGGPVCEDVEALRAAGNVDAPCRLVNPYPLPAPIAPHLAARRENLSIELSVIADAFAQLRGLADVVVVEGVGGFKVPLNPREDTADLAKTLGLPVVMVVGMRLGCLNHALLTEEAVRRAGLRLAGWVANSIDPHMAAFEDNLSALQERLPAPLLGVLPYFPHSDSAAVAAQLRIDLLLS